MKLDLDNKRQLDRLYNDKTAGWYCLPTKHDCENLQVGDYVPNPFGTLAQVKSITYRGVSVQGKSYVGFYVNWNDNSTISDSFVEDKVQMTLPLCNKYSRYENVPV